MKDIIILITIFCMLSIACQQQKTRYTQSSPEIDAFMKLNKAYVTGDYDFIKSIYSDTAKIYYNSVYPLGPAQVLEGMIASLEQFTEYHYSETEEIEMVITDDGEKWVNYWGVFVGTLEATGNVVEIPMHLSLRFVDGKIVEESGYWDNEIITTGLKVESDSEGD